MRPTDFAKYLSLFLRTYMPGVRNVSTNTIKSYRDTFRLLLSYCQDNLGIQAERLTLELLTANVVLGFLDWLQEERKCCSSTRNQRLAAVHAFLRYVQIEEPVLLFSCQKILAIAFKKQQKPAIQHLTPEVLRLILEEPDKSTRSGRRNLTILSLLYDSGARVQELVDLRVRDVRLHEPPVLSLTGKGRKTRTVPIMHNTALLLAHHFRDNGLNPDSCSDMPLFVNRQSCKFTRAGISYILQKYSAMAREKYANVPEKITPHVIRHTKAMHLYQSGVPLVYIRDFLGHVDITTTDIYARADTEMKRPVLERAYPEMTSTTLPDWNHDENLMSWLTSL